MVTTIMYLKGVISSNPLIEFREAETLEEALQDEWKDMLAFSMNNGMVTASLSITIHGNCVIANDAKSRSVHVVAPYTDPFDTPQ